MTIGIGGCENNKEEIYQTAWDNGIRLFDDGWGYTGKLKNTEFLGHFLENKKDYEIIEKFPVCGGMNELYKELGGKEELFYMNATELENTVRKVIQIQLDTMKQNHFKYYLYHAIFDRKYCQDFSYYKAMSEYTRIYEIFDKLKKEGIIEKIGFSAHIDYNLLVRFVEHMKKNDMPLDVAMISYNKLNKDGISFDDNLWDAPGLKGIEYLKKNNITTINMCVTDFGKIPAVEAYKFAAKAPLDITLIGTSNKEHLLTNIKELKNEL